MLENIEAKIYTWTDLERQTRKWKNAGQKIVFTNGCFDLLHYGHLHYLAKARTLGDRLIVGLNSAASVTRLKGSHRPINDEMTRQHLMAALVFVDAVAVFEQDTPLALISLLLPDVLVKGGDWEIDQIVGSKEVISNGGIVVSLPFIEGYSTTMIEQRIKNTG